MRKTLTAGAFGGLFFAMVTGAVFLPQQDQLTLGFIDSQAVIGAYPGTAEAQATFAAENDAWQRQANAMQEEINQLNQELERQSMAMTQERRLQLTAELQQKAMDYQTFIDDIWGQTGRAYERNQELMRPIIETVNALLERVGEEEGYDYIFDAASGGIVWADPVFDLTPKIIEMLGATSSSERP